MRTKLFAVAVLLLTVAAVAQADWVTTTVTAGSNPYAVAVNPVTNRIYVTNSNSSNVTVIDGATNATTTVPAGSQPLAVAVNPVTNKIYVANQGGSVTVIDGATNATTTVAVGVGPTAVAVNPVTNKTYVANNSSNNVTVITDVPANDTEVRAAFDRLPGDTTSLGRPTLTGKGVNRWTPGRTAMMGVGNRMNTAQTAWVWANVTSGAGTDSITWTYNWGTDSLIAGENFVCAVPLEDQAATTNNLGMGTPFAGNLEVYPVYRIGGEAGQQEVPGSEVRMTNLPTIVRGVLFLPIATSHKPARCGGTKSAQPGAGSQRHSPPRARRLFRARGSSPSRRQSNYHKVGRNNNDVNEESAVRDTDGLHGGDRMHRNRFGGLGHDHGARRYAAQCRGGESGHEQGLRRELQQRQRDGD
jgi:YVTN family beta-propeller protein